MYFLRPRAATSVARQIRLNVEACQSEAVVSQVAGPAIVPTPVRAAEHTRSCRAFTQHHLSADVGKTKMCG